jgi:hypothetical protein
VRLLRERNRDVESERGTKTETKCKALEHSSPSDVMRGGEPREEE